MLKIVIIVGLLVVAAIVVAVVYGARNWADGTRELRARIENARMPIMPKVVNFRELEGLPEPVQQYFRTVLKEGQPMVTGVRVRHQGTFNMGETSDQWRPFTSDQLVITRRPGFDWDGRVKMMPGLTVRVHDAYVAGEGILYAALLGLIPLVDLQGGGDVAEGELMRFFAEAAWYPTALLPSQGVRWKPIDARSARAMLTDGAVTLTMLFSFNDSGVIETVRVEARGRTVGKKVIPTPWHGRFWNYQERGGMQVPLEGEVAWLLPEGAKPYWRGRITEIQYEFAK
ncbi:MAG: hypothetical protein LDL14_05875 [Nitrospira sp.]|nr:hypothetical protein [Nitrospira sp.]